MPWDISFDDARDSADIKTTTLFALQEEIDVVLLSSPWRATHFTLSLEGFLRNTSSEKFYPFIVFIKCDKVKRRRLVLDYHRQLSPIWSTLLIRRQHSSLSRHPSSRQNRRLFSSHAPKSRIHPTFTHPTCYLSHVDLFIGATTIVAEVGDVGETLERSRPLFELVESTRDALKENMESFE